MTAGYRTIAAGLLLGIALLVMTGVGVRESARATRAGVWIAAAAARTEARSQAWHGLSFVRTAPPAVPPPDAAWQAWWDAPLPGAAGVSWSRHRADWYAAVRARQQVRQAWRALLAQQDAWGHTPPLTRPAWVRIRAQITSGQPRSPAATVLLEQPQGWLQDAQIWARDATTVASAPAAAALPATARATLATTARAGAALVTALESAIRHPPPAVDTTPWLQANEQWLRQRPPMPSSPAAALVAMGAVGTLLAALLVHAGWRTATAAKTRSRSEASQIQQEQRVQHLRRAWADVERGLTRLYEGGRLQPQARWTAASPDAPSMPVLRRLNGILDNRQHWVSAAMDIRQGLLPRLESLREHMMSWARARGNVVVAAPRTAALAQEAARLTAALTAAATAASAAAESTQARRWQQDATRDALRDALQNIKGSGEELSAIVHAHRTLRDQMQRLRVLWLNAAVVAAEQAQGEALLLLAQEGQHAADDLAGTLEDMDQRGRATQAALRTTAARVEAAASGLHEAEQSGAAALDPVAHMESDLLQIGQAMQAWHAATRALALDLDTQDRQAIEAMTSIASAWIREIQDILAVIDRQMRTAIEQEPREDAAS